MNEENSLLTGAVRPALLRYALPIILSMVATQFYAVADTMIIGLRLINTPAEILDTAVLYGHIYLLGLPFLMPYDLSKECVMGCGDSKTPLKVIVATSVMNIVLDLVLVGPFGVAGAAAATAVAQVAGAVYMVAFLRRTQMDAAFSPRMLKARYARDIFRLSAPAGRCRPPPPQANTPTRSAALPAGPLSHGPAEGRLCFAQ